MQDQRAAPKAGDGQDIGTVGAPADAAGDVASSAIRAARDELFTLRDWLRFSVSQFTAAGLVYGHGTANALDEAAYLLLSTLDLPIDQLDPWLEARLTSAERERVAGLIARRIETRKPAAYLLGEAWLGPYRFQVDERVIVPRSFLGELLLNEPDTLLGDAHAPPRTVLDLCTGSGCLAILAAHVFEDAAFVGADLSKAALDVARANVADHGVADRVRLITSDLFAALDGERFDLILSNPPYVRRAAVEAFPPEYAAEPPMAHLGGEDGLDLVRRILDAAGHHLTPEGRLVVEIGQGREIVESDYPDMPFLWLDTETSHGEVFAIAAADLPRAGTR